MWFPDKNLKFSVCSHENDNNEELFPAEGSIGESINSTEP